mgnify:FL=1
MALFNFDFTIRSEFNELESIFQILNKMAYEGQISTIDIKIEKKKVVENNSFYYAILIDIHRCKASFASIQLVFNLEGNPSDEFMSSLNRYSKLVRKKETSKLAFKFQASQKNVILTVYDSINYLEKPETFKLSEELISVPKKDKRLLNLSFQLRKPFPDFPSFISIMNKLYATNCVSSFVTLKHSTDGKSNYLNLVVCPNSDNVFSLTFSLLENSIPVDYPMEIAKFNFACSKVATSCPVLINSTTLDDTDYGPNIWIELFESEDERTQGEINKMFQFLNNISPL